MIVWLNMEDEKKRSTLDTTCAAGNDWKILFL